MQECVGGNTDNTTKGQSDVAEHGDVVKSEGAPLKMVGGHAWEPRSIPYFVAL